MKSNPKTRNVVAVVCAIALLVLAPLAWQIRAHMDAQQRANEAQQQQRAAAKVILKETAGARPLDHNL